MKKPDKKAPPDHLSTEAQAWWHRIMAEYEIADDGGLLILQTALEAFGRMRDCQAAIATDGVVQRDRFGQPKAHPLLSTERDARAQMLAALKHLNLDIEPLRDRVGRPGGS